MSWRNRKVVYIIIWGDVGPMHGWVDGGQRMTIGCIWNRIGRRPRVRVIITATDSDTKLDGKPSAGEPGPSQHPGPRGLPLYPAVSASAGWPGAAELTWRTLGRLIFIGPSAAHVAAGRTSYLCYCRTMLNNGTNATSRGLRYPRGCGDGLVTSSLSRDSVNIRPDGGGLYLN